jgi:hypothetical protein
MKASRLTLVNLAIALLLLGSPLVVQVTSSQGVYDPWSDLDADGDIDIYDIVHIAGAYGTTGDETKNVNVMNWPITTQTTVFYEATHSSASGYYNASGFGHIHITWWVGDLSGVESVTVEFYGMICTPDGTPIQSVVVASWRATEHDNAGAVTLPVPSELFHFYAGFDGGTTARVDLAFYLTYA